MGIAEVVEFLRKNPNKEFTTTEISEKIGISRVRVLSILIRMKKHLNLYPHIVCKYKYIVGRRITSNGIQWCNEKRYVYSWVNNKQQKNERFINKHNNSNNR